jgi:hypothetical protein
MSCPDDYEFESYEVSTSPYETNVSFPGMKKLSIIPLIYTHSSQGGQNTHVVVDEQKEMFYSSKSVNTSIDATAMRPSAASALSHTSAASGFLTSVLPSRLKSHIRIAPASYAPSASAREMTPVVRMADGAVWDNIGLAAALVRLQKLDPKPRKRYVLCIGADPIQAIGYFTPPKRNLASTVPHIFKADVETMSSLKLANEEKEMFIHINATISDENKLGLNVEKVKIVLINLRTDDYDISMLPDRDHKQKRNSRTWNEFLYDTQKFFKSLTIWSLREREDAIAISGGGLITATVGAVGLSFATQKHGPRVITGTSGGAWGAHIFISLKCPDPKHVVGSLTNLLTEMGRRVKKMKSVCNSGALLSILKGVVGAYCYFDSVHTRSSMMCEAVEIVPNADFDWERVVHHLLFDDKVPTWERAYRNARFSNTEFGLTTAILTKGAYFDAEKDNVRKVQSKPKKSTTKRSSTYARKSRKRSKSR